jgi:ribosomal protein L4
VGSIQDQHLMLEENVFGDHGTNAARAQEPGNRNESMNKKQKKMAHRSIVARGANSRNYAEN